jgi:hypothetical protein
LFVPQIDLTSYYEFKKLRPFLGVSTYLPSLSGNNGFNLNDAFIPSINLGVYLKNRETELMIEFKGFVTRFGSEGHSLNAFGVGFAMTWL